MPFSLWFSNSYNLSFRKLFGTARSPVRNTEDPHNQGVYWHSEKTPAATMLFHWIITNLFIIPAIFILQPVPYSSNPAYIFLVTFYDYVLDVFWFASVGLSLVYLRLWPGTHRWRKVSKFPHWLSTTVALIFSALNIFPVVGVWIYDPSLPYETQTTDLVKWYVGPTIGLTVLGISLLYWAGFRSWLLVWGKRTGKYLSVERTPIIRNEPDGSYLQVYEIVKLKQKAM